MLLGDGIGESRLCASGRVCHGACVAVFFGDKRRFAAEIGEWSGPTLRRVDLWAADQWLTCEDNTVYTTHFQYEVGRTAEQLRSRQVSPLPFAGLSPEATHRRLMTGDGDEEKDDELRGRFWLFHRWEPTTDNVLALVFRSGDEVVITFQFWREAYLSQHPEHAGAVFATKIEAEVLAGILDQMAAVLSHRAHVG